MPIVFIAIGSNVGSRHKNIKRAIAEMGRSCKIIASSSIYESEPMYVLNQPKFLNMVVKIATDSKPEELLKLLQGIEKKLGLERNKKIRFGPRTIDLDILIYKSRNWELETEKLILPHPRMLERPFVLIPLYEIEKKDWVRNAIVDMPRDLVGGVRKYRKN